MQMVTMIGLDIAKSVFQVHGVDAEGKVLIRRKLRSRYVRAFFARLPPCLVGIEACATSHHWSRELKALGHTVRLMPPAYVKPYVKRQKNDAAAHTPALHRSADLGDQRYPRSHGRARYRNPGGTQGVLNNSLLSPWMPATGVSLRLPERASLPLARSSVC